jgi:hypothetical protein
MGEGDVDCVSCRHFKNVWLKLPCNWSKDGFCGVDGRECDVESV